jgi:hypothetical protein
MMAKAPEQCSSCGGFGGRGHKCPTLSTHKTRGEDHYQCREVKAERDELKQRIAELEGRLEGALTKEQVDEAILSLKHSFSIHTGDERTKEWCYQQIRRLLTEGR